MCSSGDECASGACAGGYCQGAGACSSDSVCGVGPNGQNVCVVVHMSTPSVGVCYPSCLAGAAGVCPAGGICCGGTDVNRSSVDVCMSTCVDD